MAMKFQITGLSVNNKIVLGLRTAIIVVGLYYAVGGKPPAKAQFIAAPAPVASVITNEDSQQDIQLSKVNEWHVGQQEYNATIGAKLEELTHRIDKLADDNSTLQGTIKGGGLLLAALSGLAVFFQLKKRD